MVCRRYEGLVGNVVGQESTDVSRYDPPLSSANLYSAATKSFQQARLHLENIVNPTDEVHDVYVFMSLSLLIAI